jgi:hypothetical protein
MRIRSRHVSLSATRCEIGHGPVHSYICSKLGTIDLIPNVYGNQNKTYEADLQLFCSRDSEQRRVRASEKLLLLQLLCRPSIHEPTVKGILHPIAMGVGGNIITLGPDAESQSAIKIDISLVLGRQNDCLSVAA